MCRTIRHFVVESSKKKEEGLNHSAESRKHTVGTAKRADPVCRTD
jgi:hypothetical protein